MLDLKFKPAQPDGDERADDQASARHGLESAHLIPVDFCWRGYIVANGDLWEFTTERLALQHYLNYGLHEERIYQRAFDADFFRKLYCDETDQRSAAELEEVWRAGAETGFANLHELLWSTGFRDGTWPLAFSTQSYIVYNNLQHLARNDIQAIAHFLTIGLTKMLAISSELEFDPQFRRALFGDSLQAPDHEIYRNWIQHGLPVNEPANERHFLHNLGVNLAEIPDGFLWRQYLGERAQLGALPATKWHAFEHFALHGVLERGPLPLTAQATGPVLLALADRFITVGRMEDADRLYERIFMTDAPMPVAWQHAGDNAFRAGQHARALNMYGRVEKAGAANFWTFCNFIDAAIIVGDYDIAAVWIDKALAQFPRNQRLLDFFHSLLTHQLDLAIQRHITRLRAPDFSEDDKRRIIKEELDRLYRRAFAKYELQFGAPARQMPARPAGRPLRVAILANQDLPQCTYYRVTQKLEQLSLAGIEARVFARHEAPAFRDALACADIAIFYRLATNFETLDSIALCNYLGTPSVYEIDDLVFDGAYFPDAFAAYEGQITAEQHFELRAGVGLVESFAGFCTHGIASTAHLLPHLGRRVTTGQVAIHRNGLSPELAACARNAQPRERTGGPLRIFYGSGTKAHGADFQDMVVPALKRLLNENEDLIFVACGHVDVAELLLLFPNQVQHLPMIADRDAYIWQIRMIDINIAVLRGNAFNDCKSEIKWLEAAALGIPSVVSDVGGFRETLTPGSDVILSGASAGQWYRALRQLIDDPALRRNVGENARRLALALYSPEKLGQQLEQTLDDFAFPRRNVLALARPQAGPLAIKRKPRILFVNVFYPPQSIGGATRVVKDEVAGLAAQGDFEIAVLCGNDDPGAAYALHSYWNDGIRVFSINTPPRAYMDWLPDDAAVAAPVDEVLAYFQPDLVHFHATQRLTISAVKAVQRRNIPYVVTVHDAWWISDHQFLMDGRDYITYPWQAERFVSDGNPHTREASAARRFKLMGALSAATRVVAVSDSFAEIYRRAGVPGITVLQNAVSRLPPLQPMPAPAGKVRLGQIGGMTYHKGFFILKQAMMRGQFDQLELVVVDHAAKASERRYERWGKTDVTIIGKTRQEQAGELFGRFDVLVALSTWPESFGLVTREALAYGKWIIASDRGAIGEVVVENVNGFRIDVDDEQQITAAFEAIQRDPQRYRAPPEHSSEIFTLDAHLAELAALYQDVLQAPEARSTQRRPLRLVSQ